MYLVEVILSNPFTDERRIVVIRANSLLEAIEEAETMCEPSEFVLGADFIE